MMKIIYILSSFFFLSFDIYSQIEPTLITIKFINREDVLLSKKENRKIDTIVRIIKANSQSVYQIGVVNEKRIDVDKDRVLDIKRTREIVKYLISKGINEKNIISLSYDSYYKKSLDESDNKYYTLMLRKDKYYFKTNKQVYLKKITD